ncbi:MAG: hypothetical protein Q9159_002890 [Coniocarpon cinnabarinum]
MTATTVISQSATPFTKKSRNPFGLASGFALSKPHIFRDHVVYPSASARSTTANPQQDIRALSWSPLGTLLASADSRILRVWNPQRADVKHSIELKLPVSDSSGSATRGSRSGLARPSHLTGTECVIFNPSLDADLASLGSDGVLRFWDVRARAPLVSTITAGDSGLGLCWRPPQTGGDEVVVATKNDNIVTVSRRQQVVVESQQWDAQIYAPSFSNNGQYLLLPCGNGRLQILSYPDLTVQKTVHAHPSAVTRAISDPRGRHVATVGADSLVSLWDVQDWSCKQTYPGLLTGPGRSLSFSFDGAYLVAGDDNGGQGFEGVGVVHVEDGEEVCRIECRGEGRRAVTEVAWHPGRYWVAFGGGREGEGGLKVAGVGGGLL